jgi:hypothetical protein
MTIPSTRDRLLATYNVANRFEHNCRVVNVAWKTHSRIGKIRIKPGQKLVCDQPCGNFY